MAKIDEIPRGHLSSVILMCLKEKDKYGYEIIEEVLNKTNGKMSIKQPSLYSNLKRMEEQSLISSYWRDSEIGGRRHYYHLTDLGKKHLEKWQTNFSFSELSTQSSDNNTKVVHQENLFNLSQEIQSVTQPEYNNEQKNSEDTFVQFDLFSQASIIAPPSETSIKKQDENLNYALPSSVNAPQNPIFTEYEAPIEVSTKKFEYVKKSNKSFADTIKNIKKVDERKYDKPVTPVINTTKNIENNNILDLKVDFIENSTNEIYKKNILNLQEETPTFAENSNVFEETNDNTKTYDISESNTETSTKVGLSSLEGYTPSNNVLSNNNNTTNQPQNNLQPQTTIQQKQENKDDGVFITERLEISDIPKQPKFEARKFEVYISDDSLSPKFKNKQSSNYEDRIKELYEKSKSNAENQELEIIESKIKFTSYAELQEFYNEQNIKFKPYEKTLYSSTKDFDMIKINKLNMLSTLLLFITFSVVSTIFGIFLSLFAPLAKFNNVITYTILPLILLILFIVSIFEYNRSPYKRIAYDINKFKFNIKLFVLSILVIPFVFAINLLLGFNFNNIYSYCVTLIYPCILSLIYIFYYAIQKILIKTKGLY